MKQLFFFSFIYLLIYSCSKDVAIPKKGNTTPVSNASFVPLTVGSFWVYNYYYVDTLGNETFDNTDTVRIIQDSIINGKTYAMFEGLYYVYNSNNTNYYFRRDSLSYLVNENGGIYFSSTNFTDTLQTYLSPNGFHGFSKMNHKDSIINVPAGSFKTYDLEITSYMPASYSGPIKSPRYFGTFYSKGIGIIKNRTAYSQSPNYIDSKLVSYYIAP